MSVSLRTYVFLDALQPQLTGHVCTTCRGFWPVPYESCLYVEVAPGMAVHKLLDRALKGTQVHPATIVVERAYGMVMLHGEDKGQVQLAGQNILDELSVKEVDRVKPKLATNTIIRSIEPDHAQVINKLRSGSMINPGESLLIMETNPAAYIAFAANEAEKAANVQLLECTSFGAFGRLYMGGSEAEIDAAAEAANAAIASITGREEK
ncbi:MAG: BMC domain-containing protein [Clostridia bacterium]|nr:BMC domain-containing protein [Deltaproteobacteria bacterium]